MKIYLLTDLNLEQKKNQQPLNSVPLEEVRPSHENTQYGRICMHDHTATFPSEMF